MSDISDGATGVEPRKKEIKIQSINFLNENNQVLPGTSTQYVNLDKNNNGQTHLGVGSICHLTQLGRKLKFKVKFNQPGSHKFKVKLTPASGNSTYSPAEINRHSDFKHDDQEHTFTTDSNGEKIIESVFVSPAGKDIFTLSATAEEGAKNTKTLEIRNERLIYYVPTKMEGVVNAANSVRTFETQFAKHGITFADLSEVTMGGRFAMGVVDTNNQNELRRFRENINLAYNRSAERVAKKPYGIAVVFVNHLARKVARQDVIKDNVMGGSLTLENIIIQDRARIRHPLWHNLGSEDSWYVACWFTCNEKSTYIPIEKCTPVPARGSGNWHCDSVDIDVSHLPPFVTGTITLTVNWIGSRQGGFAIDGTNITAISTHGIRELRSESNQNQIIIHEIGHIIGMVPFADERFHNADNSVNTRMKDKTKLDPHNFQYTGFGHSGSHCYKGTALRANFNDGAGAGSCVMFGATNNQSEFCDECAEAVKKVDLSKGIYGIDS